MMPIENKGMNGFFQRKLLSQTKNLCRMIRNWEIRGDYVWSDNRKIDNDALSVYVALNPAVSCKAYTPRRKNSSTNYSPRANPHSPSFARAPCVSTAWVLDDSSGDA